MSSSGLVTPGRYGRFEVSQDGVVYHNVGGIVDVGMTVNIDELECTTHDSNGAREYIPNHHDVTFELSGRHLGRRDPGQGLLLDAAFNKLSLNFRYYIEFDPGSDKYYYEGTCFPTNLNPNSPLDDTTSLDMSLRASGVQQLIQT